MSELSGPLVASFESFAADVVARRWSSPTVATTLQVLFPPVEPPEGDAPPAAARIRVVGWRERNVVLVEASAQPEVNVEDGAPLALDAIEGTGIWAGVVPVVAGTTPNYAVRVNGRPIGSGISPLSFPGYTELSHPIPGAPTGTLSERYSFESAIYDGAQLEYWLYVNHGVDLEQPAPLMVWLDGSAYLGAADAAGPRVQTVTDNLVHRGAIPPMIHLFVNAATGGARDLDPALFHTGMFDFRTQQYDEISDEFIRHLLDEVLPDVERHVRIRPDAYSRGIFGISSGGTASFKTGWLAPEAFSRLYPYLASFDGWGWRPSDGIDGAHILPLEVRRGPRKNLRVWLSAGAYDEFDFPIPDHLAIDPGVLDRFGPTLHRAGSQLLGNFEMAQALKTSGYDFHFRCGTSGHDFSQAAADLPESLAWLWRDYDPERTEQIYEPDFEERAKPPYRFAVVNRDTW